MLITPLQLALEMEGMLVIVTLLDIKRAGIFRRFIAFTFVSPVPAINSISMLLAWLFTGLYSLNWHLGFV